MELPSKLHRPTRRSSHENFHLSAANLLVSITFYDSVMHLRYIDVACALHSLVLSFIIMAGHTRSHHQVRIAKN